MQKACKQCAVSFEITEDDFEFYDKVSPVFGEKKYQIPPPTLCPDCRQQRRFAWRNERFLFPRTCAKCQKEIVSIFSSDAKCPVYCNKCWWGDDWDARVYGKDFDFSRPFFDQLKELMDTVPELTIQNDNGVGSQNSQYCQDAAYLKNCYFVIGTWYTEDSFYCSINSSYNRTICDCINISRSEIAYESCDSQSLYNCAFMQNCENCSDCYFGFDLKGCRNCFGCIGLRQKQFHIFNEPVSREEYKKWLAAYNIGSHESLEKMKIQYADWILKFPRKNMNLQNCENCEGNDIFNSRNSYGFSILGADHAKYCYQGDLNSYSYDITNSGRPNWCYEGMTPDDSYMSLFTWFSWKNKYNLYTINCHSSEHLFGCISLHRAKYCILNKQYSREEYEKLVPKIIEKMGGIHSTSSGQADQWGEFPPVQISYFPYNETVANEYFPLSKEEVLAKGWQWKDPDKREYLPQTYEIPDNILGTEETITKETLACEKCGKNYKIIPEEFKFYQKIGFPVPRKCPNCRHLERLQRRPPYKLWTRQCAKCHEQIKTAYAPDRPEIVYCESCYLKEVY